MNIEKYKNDGWGLSKKCLEEIELILNDLKEYNIVEFGSGISTSFLIDYLNENNINGNVYSFDNDYNYCSTIKDDKLHLSIKNIMECNDNDYDSMFKNKKIDLSLFKNKITNIHTRQKNCFYNISLAEIPKKINMVILDGPHGNGRNIAYLYLKNILKQNSYIIIDDYNHYDFCEKFEYIFPNNKLLYENTSNDIDKWNGGGNYKIYKIL